MFKKSANNMDRKKCKGLTKKGNKCIRYAIKDERCAIHKDLVVSSILNRKKCKGFTKKGNKPTMSNFYTKFISSFIFPLHERIKKHQTVQIKNSMNKSQWWTQEEIEQLQISRLKQLISECTSSVPFYKKLLQERGLTEDDFNHIIDLQKLPFLTKKLIRNNIEEIKSKKAIDLARFNTGGSSGEPLIFYIGNERVSHDVAAKWRATKWWDVDIGDKELVIWGSPIELGSQDYVRLIRDKMLRTKLLPAFEMSEEKIAGFIQEIIAFKPKMLFGYPSSISLIAKHASKHNICLNQLGIRVVFVTSERLYDEQRDIISSVFACPVANGYGGRDAGFIAHQCPEGEMHITAEDIIVEIVDKDGKVLPHGHSGEVVITHLATKDFPFIRYKTGDIAILSDKTCQCGRGLPLLEEIQGRTTDFMVAKDGTIMHGLALIYVLRDLQGMANFKIIQEDINNTKILISTDETYDQKNDQLIRESFKQRLGQSVNITLEHVTQIPSEKSGKYRYVVSHVKVD